MLPMVRPLPLANTLSHPVVSSTPRHVQKSKK